MATWGKLTDTNLAQAQILNGSGLVIGNYNDLLLMSETSSVATDGTVHTVFNVCEKRQGKSGWRPWRRGRKSRTGQLKSWLT